MKSNTDMYMELLPTIYKRIVEENISITKISKELGLNRNKTAKLLEQVYHYQNEYAVYSKTANKADFDKVDIKAAELYKEGLSITEIAKSLGVKRQCLSKRLKNKFDIEIKQNPSKKQINSNFFKYQNKLNCYWLGYVWADGCISCNCFELSSKDYDIISLFKEDIESTHKIGIKNINGTIYNRISIRDKVFLNDLKLLGIVERKSYINNELPNIEDKYYLDYIRGYIDGDGSYLVKKNNHVYIEISIGFANEEFAKKLLNKIFELFNYRFILSKRRTCLTLGLYKQKEVQQFINLLYKDGYRFLNRKHEKITDLLLPS